MGSAGLRAPPHPPSPWQPPSSAWGRHSPGVSALPSLPPLQGWHPLTPKTGKEEENPRRQDVPQESPTRAGWGREEALPPGLVLSHTSSPPHACAHPAPRPRAGAPGALPLPGLAGPRWVLRSQPRSHTHVPTAGPWAQAPPPFPAPRAPPRPQFLFTVMEPPARPSRHRGGSYRGIAGAAAAASAVPGTGADGFPAVRDHPADANPFWEQQQEILTGKRAGPCVASVWAGSHQSAVRGVWVPLPGTAKLSVWSRAPCPDGGLKGGSRCVPGSRGRNPALGQTHCATFPSAVRSWAQLIPAPDRPVGKLRHQLGK